MPGLAGGEQQRTDLVFTEHLAAPYRADQVVTRRPLAHALGQYLADDVAGGDAKAGIALYEEHIRVLRQRAELGKQVGAAGHRAAPGQVDLHVLEVGENLPHPVAVPGLEIAGDMLNQRRRRAKQQAVLSGHPVIIDDRTDIAVSPADRADALDQLIRQRLGHHLEGEGVDGGLVQLRLQLVEEAVAGPQQLAGLDRALGRAHGDALAIGHFQSGAVLEDLHPMAGQRLGFAQQQVERVHMARPHMQ